MSVQICVRVYLPHLYTCVHSVQVLCSTSTSKRYVTFFLNKNSQRPNVRPNLRPGLSTPFIYLRPLRPSLMQYVHVQKICHIFFEQKFSASKCPSKSASMSLYPIYILASTASKSYVVRPRPKDMSHFFLTKILSVQMSVQICVRVSLPHLYTCVHSVPVLCSTSTSKRYDTFFLNKNSQRPNVRPNLRPGLSTPFIYLRPLRPSLMQYVHVQKICHIFFEQKFSASKCPSKSASVSIYPIYVLASTASKSYVVRPRPKDMSHFF